MRDEVTSPVRWWSREQFETAGASEPVCDTCNKDLDEFPTAVVGSYAACSDCRQKVWIVEPGDTQYFESREYNVGLEPKRPRVNCGGRKAAA